MNQKSVTKMSKNELGSLILRQLVEQHAEGATEVHFGALFQDSEDETLGQAVAAWATKGGR